VSGQASADPGLWAVEARRAEELGWVSAEQEPPAAEVLQAGVPEWASAWVPESAGEPLGVRRRSWQVRERERGVLQERGVRLRLRRLCRPFVEHGVESPKRGRLPH
jgi:hypothetical protein